MYSLSWSFQSKTENGTETELSYLDLSCLFCKNNYYNAKQTSLEGSVLKMSSAT